MFGRVITNTGDKHCERSAEIRPLGSECFDVGSVEPYLKHIGCDGRQQNVDGDLCICSCQTAPRLKASTQFMGMTFSANDMIGTLGAEIYLEHLGQANSFASFDEHFVAVSQVTGEPVDSGFTYGIRNARSEHHDNILGEGRTIRAYGHGADVLELLYVK